MDRCEIRDINNQLIDTLVSLKSSVPSTASKYKSCAKNCVDLKQLQDVPNPKNNIYTIKNLRSDVDSFLRTQHNTTILPAKNKRLKLESGNQMLIATNNVLWQKLNENNTLEKSMELTFSRNNHQRWHQRKIESKIQPVLHDNVAILLKHFNKWKLNTNFEINLRKMKVEQNMHRNKITNFLQVLQEQKEAMINEQKLKVKIVRSAINLSENKPNVARFAAKPVSAPLLIKGNLKKQKLYPLPVDENLQRIERELDRSIHETKEEIKAINLPRIKHTLIKKESKELLKLVQVPDNIYKSLEMAKTREERRKIIIERKRQADAERFQMLQEAEEKRKLDALHEKQQQIKAFREKRRKEQENVQRIAQEKEKWLHLKEKANIHYELNLKRRALRPLLLALEHNAVKIKAAIGLYELNLLQTHFSHWKIYALRIICAKRMKSDGMYNRKVLKHSLEVWKEDYHQSVIQKQVAEDYYDFKLTNIVFIAWHQHTCCQFWYWQGLTAKASVHHRWKILRKYLRYWQLYPTILKIEREKFQRKQKWIQRVQEIIPNFKPFHDF